MKFLLLFCALALGATACTTLSNRRDLYNPSADAGPYHSLQPKKTGNQPAPNPEPGNPR